MFYSVFICGMKKLMRNQKSFARVIKQIETELERSDTKRIDIKRKEIKFTKEQIMGYKLYIKNTQDFKLSE